jgi:hypothetical protein
LGQLQEFLSPVKNSCEHGQKQEFSDQLQKWVPVKKSSGKKKSLGILRNPGRKGFLGPQNKFLSYRKMQPG